MSRNNKAQSCVNKKSMASSSIPFFYKALGMIKKATLDNKLLNNYQLVLDHVDGTSLDMFAFETTRTTDSNQFNPTLDWPKPRSSRKKHITHLPILEDLTDKRNLLYHKRDHQYDVCLIDPPFTTMEQDKLYGKADTAKLLTHSTAALETLYQVSCEYAFQHATAVVLVYGYKVVPAPTGWKILCISCIGGGSHPAIMSVLYVTKAYSGAVELLQILTKHAVEEKAEMASISKALGKVPKEIYHIGERSKRSKRTFYLPGTSNAYKDAKDEKDPVAHPTYLSKAMIELSQVPRPLHITTKLAALYKHSKKYGKTCFVDAKVKRTYIQSGKYSDVHFVLRVT